jgi:geranylgeranyl pyrophosphate synthase
MEEGGEAKQRYMMRVDNRTTADTWFTSVENRLSDLAVASSTESLKLQEAALYVVQGGGKRLRALLTMAVSADLSHSAGSSSLSLIPAVAIEAIHAASLVHDDLPALDNDDMRRGKPSCHKAFGEATAILVGDLLLGAALASLEQPELALDRQARLSSMLSRTWRELCVGQQLDLDAVRGPEARHRMIELKTGALFGAAAACGAICIGAHDGIVTALHTWGIKLGVLFQKLDDVDDGERDRAELQGVQNECNALIREIPSLIGRELPLTAEIASRALKV